MNNSTRLVQKKSFLSHFGLIALISSLFLFGTFTLNKVNAQQVEAFTGYTVNNNLATNSGGSGWSNNWTQSGSQVTVFNFALGCSSPVASVTPVVEGNTQSGSFDYSRSFTSYGDNGSTVYIWFNVAAGASAGGTYNNTSAYGGLGVYAGTTEKFLIGGRFGSANWGVTSASGALSGTGADGYTAIGSYACRLLVAKIDKSANTITLYIDPDFSKPECSAISSVSVGYGTNNDAFDKVVLRAGGGSNKWQYDNLNISTTSPFAATQSSVSPLSINLSTTASGCIGTSKTFTVTAAAGATSPSYNWRKRGTGWSTGGTANPWSFTTGGGGLFTGTSNNNGPNLGGINTSGLAWGMYNNGGTVTEAKRDFASMAVGQVFQVEMDNGNINSGGTVGFSLRNSSDANMVEFFYIGGQSSYTINANNLSSTTVNIPFNSQGVRFTLTVTGTNTFSVTISTSLGGGSFTTYGPYTGSFLTTSSSISRFRAFDANGSNNLGSGYDLFFNNIKVGPSATDPLYDDNAAGYVTQVSNAGWLNSANNNNNGGNSPINGATNATYTINSLVAGDAGNYDAVVYNNCSSTTSTTQVLTVNALPTVAAIAGGQSAVCLNSATTAFTNATSGGTWSILAGTGTATVTNGGTPGIATGTGAGTVTVRYTTAADGNGCTNTATTGLTVNALPTVVAIAGGQSAVCLNSATTAFTNATSGGTWSILAGTGTAIVTNGGTPGIATGTGAGTVTVRYTTAADGNGCTNTATTGLTVNALPTITASSSATGVTYNTTSQTTPLSYSATTNSPTTYSITWNTTPTNNFVAVTDGSLPASSISISIPVSTNAGTYTGNLSVKTAAGCSSFSSTSFTVLVSTATPTVTVTNNTTPYIYTGSPLGPNTASNTGTGSSYTFSYAGTGGTTYGPTATQPTNVGTYTVTATVAANGNYALASSSATAFSITTATPTVMVTNNTTPYTYTGSPLGPNTASNTGTGSSYTFSYAGTGGTTYGPTATQPTNVGTYTVTVTVAANGNYALASSSATAFSITTATPTVTVTNNTTPYTYTGSPLGPNTASNTGTGSSYTFSYAGTGGTTYGPTTTQPTNVGTYTVTATVAANGNYSTTSSSAVAFTIGKATPTLSITGTPTSFSYTGSAQGPTVTVTNNSGGTQTFAYTSTDGGGYSANTAPINAGAYEVTVTVAATSNYDAAGPSNSVTFTIAKATPTLTVTNPNTFTYDGTAKTPTVSITAGAGTPGTILAGGSSTQINAGSYTVTAIVPASTNYTSGTFTATNNFVITQATPTLTVTNTPQAYTGAPQSATVSVTAGAGAVSNILTGGATTQTSPGTYAVTADVAVSSNYTALTGASAGNFVINPVSSSTADLRTTASGTTAFESASNWEYDADGAGPGTTYVVSASAPASTNNVEIRRNITFNTPYTIGSTKNLTVSAGTADFNGQSITLKSDANGTASIGKITGTLSKATNVTVERYIPAISGTDKRAWRLLSVPTKGTQTIREAWQEGTLNPGPLENNKPGYGTQITTPYANPTGNGFDKNSVSNSLLEYNGTSWQGALSTNTSIQTVGGYFLYVRGDRTQGTSGALTDVNPTTLRTTGELYQGAITYPSIPKSSYAVIGNIYPSKIDFTKLNIGSVDNAFYIWDAKKVDLVANSLGIYQTFSVTNGFKCIVNGGSFVFESTGNKYIESGQAFFVRNSNTLNSTTVSINEDAKVTGSSNSGFRPATPANSLVSFTSSLYSVGGNLISMADANEVVFDNQYSNAVDGNDALKISNPGANFAIQQQSKALAIEGRQPITDKDTIFYNMWNLQNRTYRLELKAENLNNPGLTAILQDAHTGINTVLNLAISNTINFTVDATASSSAANRFRVVFKQVAFAPLPVSFISVSASRSAAGNAIAWKVAAESNMAQYEVERSTDGRSFAKTGTVAASAQSTYSFTDAQALGGTAFYRIKGIGLAGEVKYSAIVKLTAGNIKPGYSISPNPAEGNMVNLQFKNQAAGNYHISISTIIGEKLFTNVVAHPGGSSTQVLNITERLSAGTYQLEIIAPDKSRQTQSLVVKSND